MDTFIQDERTRVRTLEFLAREKKKKKVLHLACPFLFSLLSLLSRRRRRNMKSQECRGDVYTHCLRRAVSLAKEGRPQFTRPAFNFAHQTMAVYTAPFKAGKMQHNVTRTSSIGPSGGGRVPNNDSLVIMEPLFFLLARCGNTRRRGEGGWCIGVTLFYTDIGLILLCLCQ